MVAEFWVTPLQLSDACTLDILLWHLQSKMILVEHSFQDTGWGVLGTWKYHVITGTILCILQG